MLFLVDQIHDWAITQFREFVLQHLKPWHEFCEENYLFDWDSVYNKGRKRKRTCEEDHLQLPDWVELANDSMKTKLRTLAKEVLTEALEEEEEQERRRKIIKRLFPSGQAMKDITTAR